MRLFASQLSRNYSELREIGIVKNKRHFSVVFLGRAKSYLHDVEQRDRLVPIAVVELLRFKLQEIARATPPGVSEDIRAILEGLDRDLKVTELLGR